jgi:lysophospholipase L1-like esterase
LPTIVVLRKIAGMKSLLSLRNFFLAAAFSVSVLADHSAVTPAPRPDQPWKTRAELLNKRVKENQDAELLFIGDSITQGWEGSGAKEVWEKYYGSRKAVNIGIGGDRTQHVLYRLQNGNLEGIKPKAAVVMIGTNNSNGEDNSAQQIAEGVKAIVKELRTKEPQMKILLLGIFPRGENINPQRGKITQCNQIIQKLDDGKNVFYMDIGHRFLEEDGTLSATIMPDYLHLSQKGYEIWADAIEPKLAELLK